MLGARIEIAGIDRNAAKRDKPAAAALEQRGQLGNAAIAQDDCVETRVAEGVRNRTAEMRIGVDMAKGGDFVGFVHAAVQDSDVIAAIAQPVRYRHARRAASPDTPGLHMRDPQAKSEERRGGIACVSKYRYGG